MVDCDKVHSPIQFEEVLWNWLPWYKHVYGVLKNCGGSGLKQSNCGGGGGGGGVGGGGIQ